MAPITLGKALEYHAKFSSKKPAIVTPVRTYSYEEVNNESNRLANAMLRLGISQSESIFSLLSNGFEFAVCFLASQKTGVKYVPVNSKMQSETLQELYVALKPSLIFISKEQEGTLTSFLTNNSRGIYGKIITLSITEDGWLTWDGALPPGSVHEPQQVSSLHEISYLNMTSGTTGSPKAATITPANMYWNAMSASEKLKLKQSDIHMCTFPAYLHPHEQLTRSIYLGGTTILAEFDIDLIWDFLTDMRVTCMMSNPPIYATLLRYARLRNLSLPYLRIAESGGAVIPARLVNEFNDYFQAKMVPVWGSTETTGIAIAATEYSEPFPEHLLGTPCPGYEVEIIDRENGQTVVEGEIGELRFRGPGVSSGYFLCQGKEKSAFLEGWYYSGDLAYRTHTGNIFFVGRRDDMVKQQGLKVYPTEIESVLKSHPDVEDVSVFGFLDPNFGESIAAAVIMTENCNLSVQELFVFCQERISSYKIPRVFEILPTLPRTIAGKVDRAALQKQIESKRKQVVSLSLDVKRATEVPNEHNNRESHDHFTLLR